MKSIWHTKNLQNRDYVLKPFLFPTDIRQEKSKRCFYTGMFNS